MLKIIIYQSLIIFTFSHASLISPQNGELFKFTHILFEWEQVPSALHYNLQVSNTELFDDIILDIYEETTIYIEKNLLEWGNNYFWRLKTIFPSGIESDWSGVNNFQIDENFYLDVTIDTYNNQNLENSLIMFSGFTNFSSFVIDKNGNQICEIPEFFMNHIDKNGRIYGMLGAMHWNIGGRKTFYNQTLWNSPDNLEIDPHEIKQIPNGNFMSFVPEYQLGPIPIGAWTQDFQNLGYIADGVTNEFLWAGLKIVELDKHNQNEVWNWNPFEYFSMNDFYEPVWYETISSPAFDWMHSNSFYFDEMNSEIYTSNRHLSRISKIDYPSGEIIWNMGLPSLFNTGEQNICTELLFSYQHNIQLIENGDLLFFDNGNLNTLLSDENNPVSRVRRIKVIENRFCDTIWQFNLPESLYGSAWGSVQLLENGNYLIYTRGDGLGTIQPTILEVGSDSSVIWKMESNDPNVQWYRAYAIPGIHPNAFSTIVQNFHNLEINGANNNFILNDNVTQNISFKIFNKSNYSQSYVYLLRDLNQFETYSDTIYIQANNNSLISIDPIIQSDTIMNFSLDVWPIYHEYAKKNYVHNYLNSEKTKNISKFILHQNFPNPFNPTTKIKYDLPKDELVTISVYDLIGRNIKLLVNTNQSAGYRSVHWDGTNNFGEPVSAGMYIYTIHAGEFRKTKKMVLLK